MPFTPFHMGFACAIKAVAGRSFSVTVFAFAQVAMDVEPLVHLMRGEGVVHGISHTFLGGTLIGVLAVLVGRPLCQFLLNHWTPDPDDRFMKWLRGPQKITWRAAIIAAFVGTYSHVLLDSLIHADMQPFLPFDERNPLLGHIGFGAMHLVCLGTGILGLLGMVMVCAVESRS
jgi:hypothetical protein